MKNISIAVDGPAGSGKSTISKIIAKDMNIIYLDTGAMYRAFGLYALRKNVNIEDRDGLVELLKAVNIEIKYEGGEQKVLLNGEDVSGKIRTNDVSKAASAVAVVPEVRIKMVEMQRKIAEGNSVIMDGRDIGTYVLPKAQLKIFLIASPEERARRRFIEMKEKGDFSLTEEQIKEDIIKRDKNDSEREFAPLKKADDAILVDTTFMGIDDVVSLIKKYAEELL